MNASPHAPHASVVIPTWNGADVLMRALSSLAVQTWTDFETIVVDNGSSDDSANRVAESHPDVRVVQLDCNVGFAGAVNEGIRRAAGRVVVLMNNDIEADPMWLERLVGALERYPEAGAVASRMLSLRDPQRIDCAGLQLGLFASCIGMGQLDGPEFSRFRWILAASAGAAAYRRSVLDEVGLFDETFFAYCEDVDLGARILFAGHRCLYVGDAVVYHVGSATSDRMPAARFYYTMRNSLTVFFRYMPRRRLLWTPLIVTWPFVRAMIDRQSLVLALRAVSDSIRTLPNVIRVRREIRRSRLMGHIEFDTLLAGPFARRGRDSGLLFGRRRRDTRLVGFVADAAPRG